MKKRFMVVVLFILCTGVAGGIVGVKCVQDAKIRKLEEQVTTEIKEVKEKTSSKLSQLSHEDLLEVAPDQHHPKIHASSHKAGGEDSLIITDAEISSNAAINPQKIDGLLEALDSRVRVTGDVIRGDLILLGAASDLLVGGTLRVAGTTTLSSTLQAGSSTLASLTVTDGASVGGNLSVSGSASVGSITGNLLPAVSNSYNLGSPSLYWSNAYITNLVAGSTDVSGTIQSLFTINTDNTSADTESSSLGFERGTVTPNALITWDAVNDRFDINQPVYLQSNLFVTGNFDVTGAAVNLPAGSIGTSEIADSAITTVKLADGSVTSAKIVDGTIATIDLADALITTAKIADSAVTSAKILDTTIATADIADSAVTSDKILDGTIVDADVSASAAISPSKISGTAFILQPSATQTVTYGAAGVATILKMAASPTANPFTIQDSVAANKFVVDISGLITTASVNSASIVEASIATGDLADALITAAKIADSAVTSAKILDTTIATADIADSAVTNAKIADATISLGTGADNTMAGKLNAEYQVYTTNATAGTEDGVAHGLGRTPVSYVVVKNGTGGVVYTGATTWTATTIYLKCTTASNGVTILIW